MSKPKHFKCPGCGAYIRGPVKETRNEFDGVFRRRVCEECGLIIETLETIKAFYVVKKRSEVICRL